jgi:hypothetical protein
LPDNIRQKYTARVVGLVGEPYEFEDERTGETKRGVSWDAWFATDADAGLGSIEQCKVNPVMAEALQHLGFGEWVDVSTVTSVNRGRLSVRATSIRPYDDPADAAEAEAEKATAKANGK